MKYLKSMYEHFDSEDMKNSFNDDNGFFKKMKYKFFNNSNDISKTILNKYPILSKIKSISTTKDSLALYDNRKESDYTINFNLGVDKIKEGYTFTCSLDFKHNSTVLFNYRITKFELSLEQVIDLMDSEVISQIEQFDNTIKKELHYSFVNGETNPDFLSTLVFRKTDGEKSKKLHKDLVSKFPILKNLHDIKPDNDGVSLLMSGESDGTDILVSYDLFHIMDDNYLFVIKSHFIVNGETLFDYKANKLQISLSDAYSLTAKYVVPKLEELDYLFEEEFGVRLLSIDKSELE